uniref:Putative kelch repeat-containing protein n=1 Tax=uncultured bacterium RM35 TaxID=672207 RepID=D3W8L2_9BACT|nr:putative kelch repeat-containing protein [uncultured bacterium RM35]
MDTGRCRSRAFFGLAAIMALGACGDAGHTHDGAVTSAIHWQIATPFPIEIEHHSTFLHEATSGTPFVYVLGGGKVQTLEMFPEVRMAPILEDGMLGDWSLTTPIPKANVGTGIAVAGNRVYASGGAIRDVFSLLTVAETYSAPIQADGTLGDWTAGPDLPSPRLHHSTDVYGGNFYAIGGTPNLPDNLDQVLRAPIQGDGSLGAWTELAPLPARRSHHATVLHEGTFYVIGGLTGEAAATDVLRANIMADGSLDGWSVTSTFPGAPAVASAFIHSGYLYVVGGIAGGHHEGAAHWVDLVHRAPLRSDGSLGAFEASGDPVPVARAHVHQTPIHRGRIYSVGGNCCTWNVQNSASTVLVGTLR